MPNKLRALRYARTGCTNLKKSAAFVQDIVGLQPAGGHDKMALFRSDMRAYSLCLSGDDPGVAIGLSVSTDQDLLEIENTLATHNIESHRGEEAQCKERLVKAFVACTAPNGVLVEFVWRPLENGWRYFPSRDAGIVDFQGVSLRCSDIRANEKFWTEIVGLKVADWVGETAYLRLDDAHHRISLHPSQSDGILAISYEVEDMNNVMQTRYFAEAHQFKVVHGPGRQPVSGQMFVTLEGPDGLLVTFGTGMQRGDGAHSQTPRQFPHTPRSYCEWGSQSVLPEYGAEV